MDKENFVRKTKRKKLGAAAALVLAVALICSITMSAATDQVYADYDTTRTTVGTPNAATTFSKEGLSGGFGQWVAGDSTHRPITESNKNCEWVYHVEYKLPAAYTDYVHMNHRGYMYIYANFGYQKSYYVSNLEAASPLPSNFQSNFNIISWTDDTIILEYTLTMADKEWVIAHPNGAYFGIYSVTDNMKLPSSVETYWYNGEGHIDLMKDGVSVLSSDRTFPACLDKRTVEIDQKIAPITDGTVGAYTDKTVNLKPGQKGSVQMILSRPTGATASGQCEVNCNIPSGLNYVTGSAVATSSSGIAVNVDDSTGTPVIDFNALPVGETVTVTYEVEAPSSVTKFVTYKTEGTLTNIYQRDLKYGARNQTTGNPVYTQSEYDTTETNTFAIIVPTKATSNAGKGKTTQKEGKVTPLDKATDTGDAANAMPWIILALTGVGAIVARLGKRENNK